MRSTWQGFLASYYNQRLRLWPLALALFFFVLPATIQAQTSRNNETAPGPLADIIQRVHAKPSDTKRIDEAREVGLDLLRSAHYGDALTIFSAILDVAPVDQQALYGAALAQFNLGRIGEAERLARAAVEASRSQSSTAIKNGGNKAKSQTADSLVLLGVILAVKKDNAGALAAITQAVTLAPDNFDAQFALGRARYGASDPAGAAAAFRSAVALSPHDAKARFFLATALEQAGDTTSAEQAYHELLAIQPNSPEGHLGLGVLLVKLGGQNTEDGISELSRAVALNGDLYEARITLGRTLVRSGRAAEAVEHLRRAAELAPPNPEPHYQLAIAYKRLGKITEAAEETEIVKRIHSTRRGKSDNTNSGSSTKDQE